jgi:hypothetical protein
VVHHLAPQGQQGGACSPEQVRAPNESEHGRLVPPETHVLLPRAPRTRPFPIDQRPECPGADMDQRLALPVHVLPFFEGKPERAPAPV